MNTTTQPLFNRDAEASLLGGILLDNEVFDEIGGRLRPEHFAIAMHRDVFAEIARQLSAGKAADVVTVFEALRGRVQLADLTALAQYVPSIANVRRYADLVLNLHQSRLLAEVSDSVRSLAHNTQQPIAERVEQAQAQLSRLVEDEPADELLSAHQLMTRHLVELEAREQGKAQHWSTGLPNLDSVLEGGLRPGSLVVIGARPSHGKTAIAMSIAMHMAAQQSVALLSMEMPRRDVADRMTALLGRVPLSQVLRPAACDDHPEIAWDRVVEAVERAQMLRFTVSDEPGSKMTIQRLRTKARHLKRTVGLQVLMVDYIGLMAGMDSRQSRAYQIEEITKGLKSLAKELDIVVVALAQLNRQIEQRAVRRPMLSDFRDSGSIEQDADIVLGLHREFVDKPDLTGDWPSYAELAVLKNRQGRTATLRLHYDGTQTRFSSWAGTAPVHSAPQKQPARGFNGGPQ